MSRTFLNRSVGPLVLTFGLWSCAPHESSTTPPFRAPPPRILTHGAPPADLKTWDSSQQKNLDLQDQIDVKDSGAASAEVTARCRRADKDSHRVTRFSGPALISVFQIIPHELAASDFAVAPSCLFELVLGNGSGSRHIFTIGPATINDVRPGAMRATLTRGRSVLAEKREFFETKNLADVMLRTRETLTGEAAIICEDVMTKPLRYESVIALNAFDFNDLMEQPNRESQVAELRPGQLCRALVQKDGQTLAMSRDFGLHLGAPDLQITPHLPAWDTTLNRHPTIGTLLTGLPAEIAVYQIVNRGKSARQLRLEKRPFGIKIFSPSPKREGHLIMGISRNWLHATPVAEDGAQVLEQAGDWLIHLGAGARMKVVLKVIPPGPARCRIEQLDGLQELRALLFEFADPVKLFELDRSGQPRVELLLDLGGRLQFGPPQWSEGLGRVRFQEFGFCQW